jgi:hypothetical protein
LLLALGGVLSNKLYTESGTERFWGDMERDAPRWWWVVLVAVFAVAMALAIAAAGTVARRVGAVIAAAVAALLIASWWAQISAILKLGATELGPALQLLGWTVLLAGLAATLSVVAAFTSNVSGSEPRAATPSRANTRSPV